MPDGNLQITVMVVSLKSGYIIKVQMVYASYFCEDAGFQEKEVDISSRTRYLAYVGEKTPTFKHW